MGLIDDRPAFTTRVLRCFRATEFMFRYNQYQYLTSNYSQFEVIQPHNMLQHHTIETTKSYYAGSWGKNERRCSIAAEEALNKIIDRHRDADEFEQF